MCAWIHLSQFAKFGNVCLQFSVFCQYMILLTLLLLSINMHGPGCLLIVEFALTLLLYMTLQS